MTPRAKRGGNKRTVDVREVVNGLMYVLSTGCQSRAVRKDLLPGSTVNHYFCRWQCDGTSVPRGTEAACDLRQRPSLEATEYIRDLATRLAKHTSGLAAALLAQLVSATGNGRS